MKVDKQKSIPGVYFFFRFFGDRNKITGRVEISDSNRRRKRVENSKIESNEILRTKESRREVKSRGKVSEPKVRDR